MTDIVDLANDRADIAVNAVVSMAHEAVEHPTIKPTGLCLNCGEPVEGDRRWCDADCRDDWQRARAR